MGICVSVIIPVHNGAATLKTCLEAVFHSNYSEFEVILVDDASSDSSIDIAKEFPCKIIRMEKQGGPSVARNLGVAQAKGDILFFTDADVAVLKDTIKLGVFRLTSRPDLEAVIGSYTAETPVSNFVSRYKNYLHHYTHQHSVGEVSTFFTACGVIRKSIFDKLYGFDESITTTALEDVDLGYRIIKLGYKVLLDGTLQVTHLKKYSQKSLLHSDLLGRAIPYTKLMLKHRLFKGELSTGLNNVLSVFIIFKLLLLTVWMFHSKTKVPKGLSLISCVFLLYLNRGFYTFLHAKAGLAFAIRGIFMQWWGYLYSGVGFMLGILSYMQDKFIQVQR